MTLCPLPGDADFWFPVAPGITTLPETPAIIENEYSQPANSIPFDDDDFDPQNPPCDLWDILPTDTAAVPAAEMEVTSVVPVAKLDIRKIFVTRSTLNVVRGLLNIKQVTEVPALTVYTKITATGTLVNTVDLPVYTELDTSVSLPAVRANSVRVFVMMSLGSDIQTGALP